MAAGSWQGWQSWRASSSSWDAGKWDKLCLEVESEVTCFCTLDGYIGGRREPVFQKPSWEEHEEQMAGIVLKLEGQLRRALTRNLTSDDLSEYGEIGPRRSVLRRQARRAKV